jgi:hypothetical protein
LVIKLHFCCFPGEGWRNWVVKTHWRSLPLLLSLAFVQLLFRRQGDLLWQFGIISLSREGANYLAVLSLRLLIVILSAKALAVLDFKEFSTAFHSLRLPEEFSFMLSYAVHLVPSLLSSWERLFSKPEAKRDIDKQTNTQPPENLQSSGLSSGCPDKKQRGPSHSFGIERI